MCLYFYTTFSYVLMLFSSLFHEKEETNYKETTHGRKRGSGKQKGPRLRGPLRIVSVKNRRYFIGFKRTGSYILSRVLRQSTICVKRFHVRVRKGIGWFTLAITTSSFKPYKSSTFYSSIYYDA